ncbi:RNA polymerase sigma factor [Brevibacillus borstelensis]|uniref:RNA polymerase sigma factor n=1 Tax=Brevibacillus borstelensis TaxID=45462 RepID=UPI002E1EE02B|nr:RNA polymerase sigma factor [Brevibacillus borstelensis]
MDKEQIERLVVEIKASGSLEGFGMVIEQLQQPIFTYCYHMLGHRQEAEDAVQEVFIKAYENLEKYTEVVSFSAWVYKIAYHHCLNLIKRKRIFRLVPFLNNRVPADDREEGAARVDQGQLSAPLHRALSTLSPEERNLILLRVIEEKGYEELSVLFQEKPATLRKRYERAMKKCKNQLLSQKGGEMSEAFRLIR